MPMQRFCNVAPDQPERPAAQDGVSSVLSEPNGTSGGVPPRRQQT